MAGSAAWSSMARGPAPLTSHRGPCARDTRRGPSRNRTGVPRPRRASATASAEGRDQHPPRQAPPRGVPQAALRRHHGVDRRRHLRQAHAQREPRLLPAGHRPEDAAYLTARASSTAMVKRESLQTSPSASPRARGRGQLRQAQGENPRGYRSCSARSRSSRPRLPPRGDAQAAEVRRRARGEVGPQREKLDRPAAVDLMEHNVIVNGGAALRAPLQSQGARASTRATSSAHRGARSGWRSRTRAANCSSPCIMPMVSSRAVDDAQGCGRLPLGEDAVRAGEDAKKGAYLEELRTTRCRRSTPR
jgi:hypothetical protein